LNGLGSSDSIREQLTNLKQSLAKKQVSKHSQFGLPLRLWKVFVNAAGIAATENWANLNKQQLLQLWQQLCEATFEVQGKSTFKEEFVTAGGVHLDEMNFKRFESKLFPNLFMAGEVLNIDALTGGFNFQAAWTGGWLIAKALQDF